MDLAIWEIQYKDFLEEYTATQVDHCYHCYYRGMEIIGASEDQMVEEGRRMELFCVSQEDWNVCEWTRVSDK